MIWTNLVRRKEREKPPDEAWCQWTMRTVFMIGDWIVEDC